jgi:nucleotide-binding universal stress UspA family protein
MMGEEPGTCGFEEVVMGTIVVGIDGSPHSIKALQFAIAEAKLRGDTIKAIAAWTYQVVAFADAVIPPMPVEDQREAVRVRADMVVRSVPHDDVPIETVVVEGGASGVLLEQSKGADLLVIGSRGSGGFMGLLMGSVARQVTSHAVCPTVVVPG